MPISGENIGNAYVRIIAEGGDFDESIRRMFDDSDPEFEEGGRRGSRAYAKAWDQEMEKAPNQERLRRGLRDALAKGDFLEQSFFRSNNWLNFRKGLENEFGEAGSLAGHRMEQQLRKTGVEGLEGMLDNLNARIINAQKELYDESDKMARLHTQALAENARRNLKIAQDEDRRIQMLGRLQSQAILENDRRTQQQEENIQRAGMMVERALAEDRIRDIRKVQEVQRQGVMQERALNENRRRDLAKLREDFALLNRESSQLLAGDRDALSKNTLAALLDSIRVRMEKFNVTDGVMRESLRDTEHRLVRVNPAVRRLEGPIDRLGEAVGRAFGKGSRNDFINFIGSFAGGLAKFPLLLTRPIDTMLRFRNEARLAFDSARRDGQSFVSASLRYMSTWANKIGGLTTGLAGSIAGAFLFAGPLLSMLSLLAGAVTALASTISVGLIGALGAVAPVIIPFAAGLAATILGIKNLDGESKKAMKGFADVWKKGLGEAAAAGLEFDRGVESQHDHTIHSFDQIINRLTQMSKRLEPVMKEAGRGVADAMDIFVQKIGGGGNAWDKFIKAITGNGKDQLGFVGNQTRILGVAFGQTFGGLLGLLRGLLPSARQFDGWLRDIATDFNNWANSAKGQNEIRNFMEDALVATKRLGDFLGAVGDLFWTLVTTGDRAGNGIFKSLTDSINDWNRSLQADGGKGLRNWFNDSKKFIRGVGDAFVSIGRLFGTLDTEASRSLATHFFTLLAAALNDVVAILGPIARLLDGVNSATDGLVVSLGAAVLVAPKMIGWITGMGASLTGFSRKLQDTETRSKAMSSAMRQAAGVAGIALLADASQRGSSNLGLLENAAGGVAAGFAIAGPWGAAIGGGVGLLKGLWQQSSEAKERMAALTEEAKKLQGIKPGLEAKKSIDALKDSLDATTGAFTATTRAAVLNQLQSSGLLAVYQKYGYSTRTAVNASLGLGDSWKATNSVSHDLQGNLNNVNDKLAKYTAAQKAMKDAIGKSDPDLQEQINSLTKQKKELETNLATLKKYPGELRKMSREQRDAFRASEDFGKSLNKLPKNTRLKIQAEGIEPTIKGVAKVADRFHLTAKEYNPIIKALGLDITSKQVENMRDRLHVLDRERPTPLVRVDPGNSFSIIDSIRNGVQNLKSKTIYITTVGIHKGAGGQGSGYSPTAIGGVFTSPSKRLIGEAGAEAVVPLDRPLAMVDPSVRWLSAIAQGLAGPGTTTNSKTVDASGWTIVTPTEDPAAVARETINQLAAAAYL